VDNGENDACGLAKCPVRLLGLVRLISAGGEARGLASMAIETVQPRESGSIAGRLPASFDEMTVGEFLDFLRWWATLSGTDKQAILAARKQTLH
jgi:hypothetical protein